MDYYRLGRVKWWQTQAYYHALAEMGREGLLICYTDTPYVCLGLHDDLEQEINQEYCTQQRLPLIRRETGGGVVYLDNRQIFFQLVLNRDNPILPLSRTRFYNKFLTPAINVCRRLGINATLKEPADITIDTRKCSGNASGDIGEGVAYVGNLLINFDCEIMCNILRTPSPRYDRILRKTMKSNLTNLSQWSQRSRITRENIMTMLEKEFSYWFLLNRCSLDEQLEKRAQEVFKRLTAPEWLSMAGRKRPYRKIKIAEEIYLLEHKITDDVSLSVVVEDGVITEIDSNSTAINNLIKSHIGNRWDEDFLNNTVELTQRFTG
ncbi:MAG TPA: hypothetical protein DER33_06275 [Syntrophomonas sp.]|jgi:lipoate-protein ligase A|nr:hypothetical protein [Syntrophomonas sp.]